MGTGIWARSPTGERVSPPERFPPPTGEQLLAFWQGEDVRDRGVGMLGSQPTGRTNRLQPRLLQSAAGEQAPVGHLRRTRTALGRLVGRPLVPALWALTAAPTATGDPFALSVGPAGRRSGSRPPGRSPCARLANAALFLSKRSLRTRDHDVELSRVEGVDLCVRLHTVDMCRPAAAVRAFSELLVWSPRCRLRQRPEGANRIRPLRRSMHRRHSPRRAPARRVAAGPLRDLAWPKGAMTRVCWLPRSPWLPRARVTPILALSECRPHLSWSVMGSR